MKHNQSPYNARKHRVRITESDLRNIVKQVLAEGFRDGFKSAYGSGILQNYANGKYTYNQDEQGQGYLEPNDRTHKGEESLTKWNAIKDHIGGALGSIAGGRIPKNTFRGMNWSTNRNQKNSKELNEVSRSECREVFSVHGFDEETGEQLYDKRVYVDYYDLDKAIEAADELAKDYADYPGVNIYVMAGSCESPDGDVYGDEDAIYCAKKADTLNESIRRAIRRYLR